MQFSALRQNARQALKGSRGRAFTVLLVLAGATVLPGMLQQVALMFFFTGAQPLQNTGFAEMLALVTVIQPAELLIMLAELLLVLLIASPLRLGVWSWFYRLAHGRSFPAEGVFDYLKTPRRYAKSIGFTISMTARSVMWAAVFFIIPGAVCGISLGYLKNTPEDTARVTASFAGAGLVFSLLLFLLAAVLYLVWMNRYYLAPYLICEDESTTIRQAVHRSIQDTRGYRIGLFLFELSFAGWMLLSVLTCGILLFYTAPYLSASKAIFARYICEKQRYRPMSDTREFVAAHAEEEGAASFGGGLEQPT